LKWWGLRTSTTRAVSRLELAPAASAPVVLRRAIPDNRGSAASRPLIALVLVVIALSAVVRLVNLDAFPTPVFDEHYYVHDANSILHGRIGPRQPSPWKPGDSLSLAHPPLGTLSIAAGILALGDNPWGWRVPSAIAGTLLIALVYPLARRLFLSPHWAFAALVMAASDTMLIAESRIGVLDPFVALWSIACIYCALRFVQSGRAARWLVLCGATGGFAIASKWSGILALSAAAAIVAVVWWRERRRATLRAVSGALVCLVASPLAIYVASYTDYFANGHTLRQWLRLQGHMATFNWNVQGDSTMASRPPTWIFDANPIWYRWAIGRHGVVGMIAIGNPLLWWASIAAIIGLLWLAAKRREGRLAAAPLLACCLYLPWLATSRTSYIYYLAPAVPFLAIAVATALARLAGPVTPLSRWAAFWFAVGAMVMGMAAGGTPLVRLATLATVAIVLLATVIAARRSAPPLRLKAAAPGAWLYVGAVTGLAVAWLPFLVSYAASFGYYSRLAWLTVWR
jgi:dolichyl-phosphate-mannose-protein mannosyltransferase